MENPDPSKVNSANVLPHDTGSQESVSLELVRMPERVGDLGTRGS